MRERTLRIVHNNHEINFENVPKLKSYVFIYHRNIRLSSVELYKVKGFLLLFLLLFTFLIIFILLKFTIFCFYLHAFYFMLKALFVIRRFKFSSWLFGYERKRLYKKAKVNLRIYKLQTGRQMFALHILPNISGEKGNQAMKLGQLKEYNIANIFLKKSCRKWSRETSCRRLLVFKKALYKVKANSRHLIFNIFG